MTVTTFRHWQPFRDTLVTRERFNRLIGEAFGRSSAAGTETGSDTRTWAPAVDVYETEGSLVIKAEVPGVDPNHVEVRIEENKLYLHGERRFENGLERAKYRQVERAYGSFTRSFVLPASVDAEKVTAEYKDGVLTITIPKREEAKPKPIEIKVTAR